MSWLLTASPVPLSAEPGVTAIVECEATLPAGHAAEADVIFTGQVLETFDDRSRPAPWLPGVLVRSWPAGLPMPSVEGRSGVPAVRFRATTAYKGDVQPETVVHLLGTGPRFLRGQTWTVFASRDGSLLLFTTECAGDARGALSDPAAYGLSPREVASAPWRPFLAAPLLALGALALLAGVGLVLASRLDAARRRRGAEPG